LEKAAGTLRHCPELSREYHVCTFIVVELAISMHAALSQWNSLYEKAAVTRSIKAVPFPANCLSRLSLTVKKSCCAVPEMEAVIYLL
jgi:hypothetical protein